MALPKPGFDEVTEIGSEDDDSDDPGRLSFSTGDFGFGLISSCFIECFEADRTKLGIDNLGSGIGLDSAG